MVLYFVKISILVTTLTAYDITRVYSFYHREKYAEVEAPEPLETILIKECENELDEVACVKKLMKGVKTPKKEE
nr:unnamed protein product [Callosobruchus chinensis]